MRNIKLIFIFILSFLSVVNSQEISPVLGTTPKSATETKKPFSWGSMKDLPASTPFISLDGRFTIGLSQRIQGFAGLSPKQLGFKASGSRYTWKFDEGEILFQFLDYSELNLSGTENQLKNLGENYKRTTFELSPNAKLLDETFFKLSDNFATQIKFALPNESFKVIRLYLVKNRLYSIVAVFHDAKLESSVISAFDTFKLLSQAQVDAEIQKKYDLIKPLPLPQEPIVTKLKSDAEDEGFKGKIKKVIVESEDLSGTWSTQGRKMSRVEFFNEKGNFIQRDFYDSNGLPGIITVYGYIDNKRVSMDKSIRYDNSPPIVAISPLSKKEENILKPDPRYKMSYEFKYLDGKLIEKIWRSNDGKLWLRYEYKYSKNQVEMLVYSQDGKLNQHYIAIVDEKGNEIAETNLDVLKIYGEKKYRYEYEFDSHGNWIKKTAFIEVKNDGKSVFQPSYITYQTITYW